MRIAYLAAIFRRERTRFAKVDPRAARTSLHIISGPCVSPGRCALRDVAYIQKIGKGAIMVVHDKILRMSRNNAIGLIRHEFGHVIDPQAYRAGREQRADDLAERVGGAKIRYDRNEVQTVGTGTYPRPKHLPR